jgi:uncharacterized protein (DUF2141 family)
MTPIRILACGLLLSGAFAGPALAETVTVTLTGVEARGGVILASLQTREQFMQPTSAYAAEADAKAGTLVLTFKDVAPGAYALMVLHDADNDQKMKPGPGGMPGEGWAMHRGAELMGPPTFDAVSFTVGQQPVALKEPIIYPLGG